MVAPLAPQVPRSQVRRKMKKSLFQLALISGALFVSAIAQAQSGAFDCIIRSSSGAAVHKSFDVTDLTNVSASQHGTPEIMLGTVEGKTLKISLADSYGGKPVLALEITKDSKTQSVYAAAANVIGYSEKNNSGSGAIELLCREAIFE